MKRILCCLLAALCLCLPASAGDTPEGYVALTFDDGPSGPITMRLLDGLRERGAHATFFLCGYRMEQYPAPVPRYLAEGHELGVHSTVHANLTKLSPGDLRRDLSDTVRAIETSAGVRPTLLRPPGGAYNEAVLEAAEAKGLSVILWSVDTRDWAGDDPGAVLAAISGGVADGDIILMHDMSRSSVTAALALVDRLKAQGVEFVTVSRLLELRGREAAAGEVLSRLPPGND